MKQLISIFLVISVILFGCKKDSIPDTEIKSFKAEILSGNNLSGFKGYKLGQSIRIQFKDTKDSLIKNCKVEVISKEGNGQVCSLFNTFDQGIFIGQWALGTNNTQTIIIKLEGYSDSVIVSAQASEKYPGWIRTNGYPLYVCGLLPVNQFLINNDTIFAVDQLDGQIFYSALPYDFWVCIYDQRNYQAIVKFLISDSKYYIATEKSGIYKSSNKGGSWERIDKNPILDFISDFLVYEDTLYCNTYFNGFYRSCDDGKSWQNLNTINSGLGKEERYNHLCRHPSGTLFMLEDRGALLKSSNNGDSWVFINDNNNVGYQESVIAGNGNIYLSKNEGNFGVGQGIVFSTNQGITFTEIDNISGMLREYQYKVYCINNGGLSLINENNNLAFLTPNHEEFQKYFGYTEYFVLDNNIFFGTGEGIFKHNMK